MVGRGWTRSILRASRACDTWVPGPSTSPLGAMDTLKVRALITANAAEVQRLHKRIHETMRHRYKSPEQTERWETACKEFHSRYDQLAFPGGYSSAVARVTSGDTEAVEAALCFVELRPYFFRSGYLFKQLLPKLKRADLSSSQKARLERVVSAYATWRAKKRSDHGS